MHMQPNSPNAERGTHGGDSFNRDFWWRLLVETFGGDSFGGDSFDRDSNAHCRQETHRAPERWEASSVLSLVKISETF